jgi:hypothetical protein
MVKTFSLRGFTPEKFEKVRTKANEKGISVSQVVRDALIVFAMDKQPIDKGK